MNMSFSVNDLFSPSLSNSNFNEIGMKMNYNFPQFSMLKISIMNRFQMNNFFSNLYVKFIIHNVGVVVNLKIFKIRKKCFKNVSNYERHLSFFLYFLFQCVNITWVWNFSKRRIMLIQDGKNTEGEGSMNIFFWYLNNWAGGFRGLLFFFCVRAQVFSKQLNYLILNQI